MKEFGAQAGDRPETSKLIQEVLQTATQRMV